MSQIEAERFLGRLITDADFRKNAANSLEKTILGEGIVLSRDEITLLNRIDFSQFIRIADTIDDSIKRS